MQGDLTARCLCCPDCRGDLAPVTARREEGLLCPACRSVFPTRDGVWFLLDRQSRSPALEAPLVGALRGRAETAAARDACERTLAALARLPDAGSAREDESPWSRAYATRLSGAEKKNWNDRLWQREPLFALAREALRAAPGPRTVVDVGCGEGQDFRAFLARDLGREDAYVALDLSFPGLLLNRAQNRHARALYVLGSADRPPLRDALADVVICLGVLRFTERRAAGLPEVARLLRRGALLLSDPINGHFLPGVLRRRRRARSAHADPLDYAALRGELARTGLQVRYERRFSGPVYILLFAWFRRLLLRHRAVHTAAHRVDEAFSRVLGPFLRPFRPRSLLLGLWR